MAQKRRSSLLVTVGFLYAAGAETLIFVPGTSGELKILSPGKNHIEPCIPRKPREIGVWGSGAEIQTSPVDTRAVVWVSTAEKMFRIVVGETWNFLTKARGFGGGLSARPPPALYKDPAAIGESNFGHIHTLSPSMRGLGLLANYDLILSIRALFFR